MNVVLDALRDPAVMLGYDEGQWDELLRLARPLKLHARLALALADRGDLERVPPRVKAHLRAYATIASAHDRGMRWELDRISTALASLPDLRVVLLKGAAYFASGLPIARGRLTTDVDLLVAKSELDAVEQALLASGWEQVHEDEYTQHYYREWGHELPPMRHKRRASLIDVHYSIIPQTSRLKPDANELLRAARPLDDRPGVFVLDPLDMVLHSSAHLFQQSLDGGLRDLVDLHDLLTRLAADDPGVWERLVARARQLDLLQPLYYTLRYAPRFLGTAVPPAALEDAARNGPTPRSIRWMDKLVPAAFVPTLPADEPRGSRLKRRLLYIRSHWLRMPPFMLLRHLSYKAFRRLFTTEH